MEKFFPGQRAAFPDDSTLAKVYMTELSRPRGRDPIGRGSRLLSAWQKGPPGTLRLFRFFPWDQVDGRAKSNLRPGVFLFCFVLFILFYCYFFATPRADNSTPVCSDCCPVTELSRLSEPTWLHGETFARLGGCPYQRNRVILLAEPTLCFSLTVCQVFFKGNLRNVGSPRVAQVSTWPFYPGNVFSM